MALQYFDSTASADEIAYATQRDGGAVVTGLVSEELCDTVAGDLRDDFDESGHKNRRDFSGHKTNRSSAVLQASPRSVGIVAHDMVMEVADILLLSNCESYRISSLTAIEVMPGQQVQNLHRDDSMYPFQIPGMEAQIGCMWALTDFTEENGATHVIPGSHLHVGRGMPADVSENVQAIMPKGSVLFYLGSTLHGAGKNLSDTARIGLINTYSLGWLRQEVNQYLNVPFDLVCGMDERMRCLLGYTTHDKQGDRLGKYFGNDAAFVDKDDYARHYRPWPNEPKGEE